ncbi:cyclic GMP-AMP synthase DncV-like nucleotidyltransferase [Thalassospira lucentensis]|uniref:cyclic GMP-AMP synthase DncV-like nucleotidyltransferase n=1 Tax=Thalassospira lucentensis TaxID=168935 RepID=UPI0003B313CE|nr:hypothetical protein [Thalassospira lucentensis]RCK27743.1 hypothetical protein TH1_10730 [Thalassospira lucentensis MCCC 1A00383 = DSM 14000]
MFDCHKLLLKYHNENVGLSTGDRKEMRERRNANRKRLKAGLKKEGKPNPLGCYSQGSYAMWTMIQDDNKDYDIDDGVYFDKAALVGPKGGDKTARDAKEMVQNAVSDDKFKKEPDCRTNCVRVYYDAGYHVDIPVYRQITNGAGEVEFELASSDWKKSDPLAVTKWFKEQVKEQSPNTVNGGQLRRVTKLLKAFARSRLSWRASMVSGFVISKLVTEVYVPNDEREDLSLRDTMQAIVDRLDYNKEVEHPVLDECLTSGPDDPKVTFFKDKLAWALGKLDSLNQQDCSASQAHKVWNLVFSTEFFPVDDEEKNATRTSSSILKDGSLAGASEAAVDRRGGDRYG